MWAAQATGTFARLKIADAIVKGAKTPRAVASAIGADEDATFRLLRACATIGLVTIANDEVALTPVGELLRDDVPMSFRALLDEETAPGHWIPWARLDGCVTSGKSQAEAALGTDIWSYYEKHPDEGATFAAAMGHMSQVAAFGVAMSGYKYPEATKVVDVGGANGVLLASVLDAQPKATGVLFDRPNVVAAAPVRDRVEKVGGDFLKEVPAGGDLYLLKTILHDWDDATCLTILGNVRTAMALGAKLVVIEMAIPEDGAPSPVALLDLNMLVMLPGKERKASELVSLLSFAGFTEFRVVPTSTPFVVIEAA